MFIMDVRILNSDLQNKAIIELNEDPKRVQEDLAHFRNWLQKQRHLTVRLDNQFLISFLRGSKWSLEKAKEKIDNFYTIRNCMPELFTNKDPFLPEIQNVLKAGILYPLPCNTDGAGVEILYLNFSNLHPERTPLQALYKVLFMTVEILLKESDNFTVTGCILVSNYENIPLNYLSQITPALTKQSIIGMTRVYPIRVKTHVGINAPAVLDIIVNTIIKPFLPEKSKKRMKIFNSNDSQKLYDIVDKSLLPEELGGKNGSINKIAEQWKEKVESYREWFLEDAKFGCNENLRAGPHTFDENFGVDGSFRKLNID